MDDNDAKNLENFLKDHKNPLAQDTYSDLMSKLRSFRMKMEEVESLDQLQEDEQDESEDEEDIKVRAMIVKLMSGTKNSILLRDDRNFISRVLLEYMELKRKHNQ